MDGRKLHTIRGNAEWWEQVAKEINDGVAVLSVRVWQGRPYRSKQTEIMQVTKLGTQRISMSCDSTFPLTTTYIDGKSVDVFSVAANDGLNSSDFIEWFFPKGTGIFSGVVLHFTDRRY